MARLCTKCNARLSAPWRFCPSCGNEAPQESLPLAEPERPPVKNAYSGLLFGLIISPMCIIVGTMLCLTGLGAFLGIPVIIAGILAPLLGPMIGIGEPRGKCPWCGAALDNVVNTPAFDCHACNGRIAMKNQRFVKAA